MSQREILYTETILLAVLLAIIGIRGEIPFVIFYFLLIILVIAMSFLPIYSVLRPSFSKFRKIRKLKKKEKLFINKNFPKFKDFIDRYIGLIQNKGYDDISYLLGAIRNRSGIREFQEISVPMTTDFIELTNSFKKSLESFTWNKNGFNNACELFTMIIEMYNEFCVCKPIDKIKEIEKKVDDEIKNYYNNARLLYIQFLDDYKRFVIGVNKEFKTGNLREPFYEKPKEL